jgi:hypothetical protein
VRACDAVKRDYNNLDEQRARFDFGDQPSACTASTDHVRQAHAAGAAARPLRRMCCERTALTDFNNMKMSCDDEFTALHLEWVTR